MVSLATRGNIPIARTVHGKVYTNRLDIPVPSNKGPGSTMLDLKENKKLGYCIHPALMYIPDSISASIEQQIICMGNKKAKSTELAGLNGQKHPLLKKALSRSFDDIIHGCAKQKNHMLARKLMLQMKNLGLQPSRHTYNGIIKVVSHRSFGDAIRVLKKMQQKNLKPYDSTLASLSITCSKALQLDLAEAFLNQISECLYPNPYNASCNQLEKEKESKLKNKIFKILPKAAAAAVSMTFQNPPFSPGRDHKFKHHGGKGFFSGPMIPVEARRKSKDGCVETQEPTSPKISCMGQIKHKKKKNQIKKAAKTMSMPTEEKKQASKFQRMMSFHSGKPKRPAARKQQSDADLESERSPAPPLGHMRRFASGRETFSNFDWKAQIAPEERDCYSYYDDRLESDAEDEIIIPFSAPLTVGGAASALNLNAQPRKEINLWKRRTMAPPRPLQLNPVLTAK
ncbi:hypothetical protein D0Y65_039505 [Glycine soja]|uniref:Pentatricopeptide repeat-containing protein n=1 Tax=Glycine soja TaxID=3848 RepID=A0A445H9I1_GLYSO|nr:hypothetical protein D0Y65_039505 [Glycine soja]